MIKGKNYEKANEYLEHENNCLKKRIKDLEAVIESQPKQEIRLPEPIEIGGSCIEYHKHYELVKFIESQGFNVVTK